MKNLPTAALSSKRKHFVIHQSMHGTIRYAVLFFGLVTSVCFLFSGCTKEGINTSVNEVQGISNAATNADANIVNNYTGLSWQTAWELQQARAATAKYQHIKNAIKDGYADISVVVPNMGYHYMKSEYVDATFDIRKPEILVYNKNHDGSFQLVAVEYAVPINLSPNEAPEGFTGAGDVWDRNTGFGLWLLHAWVWYNNPSGVFNPTNPLVHLH